MTVLTTIMRALSAKRPRRRSDSPKLRQKNLAEYGTGDYPSYRIPALTVTNRGTLLAAFDGRRGMADLPDNITSLIRRSTNGGRTWKPVHVVRSGPKPNGYGDPSLIVDRTTGRLFHFHAASVNTGFPDSTTGNDPSDPNILQTDYSYSDDDGRTWNSCRITQDLKDPAWGGIFASSGQGIQLTSGKYAGRLVQQYTLLIDGGEYAVSAYSDDHGASWSMGDPVGPGMNENKSVELADGRLMLNVRASPHRLVAYSHDGGKTWSDPKPDREQTDPDDNGSIIRYAPNAKPSDPTSHWLLMSHNDDASLRRRLTVKMSCDDGKTWPISRVVHRGSSAYSTLVRQADGSIGVFYERNGYRDLTYASFGLRWLRGVCVSLEIHEPKETTAGHHARLDVTASNQGQTTVRHAKVSLEASKDWKTGTARIDRLRPGADQTVSVPFTPSATAGGEQTITARLSVGHRHSSAQAKISVEPNSSAPATPKISGIVQLDGMTPGGAAGFLDDVAFYAMMIRNTGNTKLDDITVTGNMAKLEKCQHSSLDPGENYTCYFAQHTITQADVQNREYRPKLRITATTPDGTKVHTSVRGEKIPIPPR